MLLQFQIPGGLLLIVVIVPAPYIRRRRYKYWGFQRVKRRRRQRMRSADTRLSSGRDAPTSAAELLADSSSASPQNNLSTDLVQPHVSQIYNTDDSDGAGLKHSRSIGCWRLWSPELIIAVYIDSFEIIHTSRAKGRNGYSWGWNWIIG